MAELKHHACWQKGCGYAASHACYDCGRLGCLAHMYERDDSCYRDVDGVCVGLVQRTVCAKHTQNAINLRASREAARMRAVEREPTSVEIMGLFVLAGVIIWFMVEISSFFGDPSNLNFFLSFLAKFCE